MTPAPIILMRDCGFGDWPHRIDPAPYAGAPDRYEADALYIQQCREYECGHACRIIRCPVTEADGAGHEWETLT